MAQRIIAPTPMPQVDLYDNAYAKVEHDLYREIRTETYGHDLGQTSWVTTAESESIPALLNLTTPEPTPPGATVLELGCGSGLYALHVVNRFAVQPFAPPHQLRITGIDLNPNAIASAQRLASDAGLSALAHFQQCDASQPLPFDNNAFHAAFANDVLCHIPRRPALLKEIFRVLRPGARFLFSDALIIGGLISHEELATRSSIGPYFFSPPGENERLLADAGFTLRATTDTSAAAAGIAQRWHDARERRREPLTTLEGADRFAGLQRFLSNVHTLTSQRRLLRHLHLAQKP